MAYESLEVTSKFNCRKGERVDLSAEKLVGDLFAWRTNGSGDHVNVTLIGKGLRKLRSKWK
jgi:hypothetical protein